MAEKSLLGIALEDGGKCALGIFKQRDAYIGKTVGIAGEHLTGTEMATELTSVLDQKVVYNNVPPEVFLRFGFPGAEDLVKMFQFKRDFQKIFCDVRDVGGARRLNPSLQNFKT